MRSRLILVDHPVVSASLTLYRFVSSTFIIPESLPPLFACSPCDYAVTIWNTRLPSGELIGLSFQSAASALLFLAAQGHVEAFSADVPSPPERRRRRFYHDNPFNLSIFLSSLPPPPLSLFDLPYLFYV